MKIVLNPQYEELREFVEKLPSTFNEQGEIVQAKRNVIKTVRFEGLNLNIKRFRKPIFFNRIVYSFFRKTKAFKAYRNAEKVIALGFQTPVPIAYIEEFSGGLLAQSYFVSLQLTAVKEIREYYYTKVTGDEELLSAFARYTANLHNAGVLHLDYSPGNILISGNEGEYDFSLVDINRMKFGEVSLQMGCENFCRLFEHDEAIRFIAEEYAEARNLDFDVCFDFMLKYKHAFERKKERKKRFKKMFK